MKEDEDSEKFKRALRNHDLAALKTVAKGDLHNHAALGGNPARFGTFPPSSFDGYSGMKKYIRDSFHDEMSAVEGYKKYVEATCEQAVDDGVVYLETSVDYRFLKKFENLSLAIYYLEDLKNKYKNVCKINFDLGLSRKSFTDFHVIKSIISDSIFDGIDLYGDEYSRSVSEFADVFAYARGCGKRCKAHIGEFGSALSVLEAVNILSLHEIQHGVHIIDSDDVLEKFVGTDIAFNVCVSSNIKMGAVENYQNHPIRKMFDAGLLVTLNSDDVLLFNTGVSDEFLNLYDLKIFDENELDIIRKNGLRRYK